MRTFLVLATLIFFLLIGYFYKSSIFSSRFVDEEDNFAIGKYLSKGEVIYQDIITNHQPVTYILSSLIHNLTKPNTTYLLVRDHRIAIFLWSFVWAVVFVSYFRLAGIIFVFLYELTKGYLFGNLFLSEVTIVYPLLFIIGLIISGKYNLNRFELLFSGICFGFVGLSFGPILPTLGFSAFLLLYQQKQFLSKTLIYIVLGIIIVFLIVLKYTSFFGYLYYYFYTNLFYTVPAYHQTYYNESWIFTILKSFSTPILAFLRTDTTPTLSIIRILSILLITNLVFLLFKRQLIKVLIILTLLGLSNIRFVYPGDESYAAGFLPWYSSLIFISSMIVVNHLKMSSYGLRVFNTIFILFAIILSIKYSHSFLFTKRDTQKDYLINYSTHTNRGDAIRAMRSPGDTLFVSPNAWLVYWQSDTDHLPRLYGYYTWMVSIPKVHSAILEAFLKTPPTYFYCENCRGLDLEKFLKEYEEIKNNGGSSMLYVLKNKIPTLSKDQLDQLKFYGFSFD